MQALSQRQAMRARKVTSAAAMRRTQRAPMAMVRADYIGSSTNIIFCTSTFLLLSAGGSRKSDTSLRYTWRFLSCRLNRR